MKVKWEVQPAPTGLYRSFHRRGWPVAISDSGIIFSIGCEDDYVPKNVKTGNHGELSLRATASKRRAVLTFKSKFATIAELKEFVKSIDEDAMLAKFNRTEE